MLTIGRPDVRPPAADLFGARYYASAHVPRIKISQASLTTSLLLVFIASAAFCGGRATAASAPPATANAATDATPCDSATHARAERDSDRIPTWEGLYKYYGTYKNCSFDADAAEGISDATARLLADHWDQLPVELVNRDPGFAQSVVGGVNASDTAEDLQAILAKSKKNCPVGATSLCAQLSHYAIFALDEQRGPSGGAVTPCCARSLKKTHRK